MSRAGPPSRMTKGRARPTIDSLSSVRFARSSCTTPTIELAMISKPKAPLTHDPVHRTIASSTARMALIRVNTFERMMSVTVRPDVGGKWLTRPARRR